jgi:hypothetical protein
MNCATKLQVRGCATDIPSDILKDILADIYRKNASQKQQQNTSSPSKAEVDKARKYTIPF